MKHRFQIVAFLVVAVAPALADSLSTDSSPMPETLSRPSFDQPFPLFVAASSTLDANGDLQRANFGREALRDMSILLSKAGKVEGCYQYGAVKDAVALGADRSELRRAFRSSPIAFIATVSGVQPGFEFGIPGQLLRLRIENVLRGQPQLAEYYYFVPVAKFRVGELEICKADERFPEPPEVGDRVLMMFAREGCCEIPYVDSHDAFEGTQIVVIPARGTARSGPDLAPSTPKLPQQQFEAWVRQLAAEPGK